MGQTSVFDNKIFNGEVFEGYVATLPNPNRTELIRSRAIRPRPDLAASMVDKDGGNYITTQLVGRINGQAPQNYDGVVSFDPGKLNTMQHARVVVGRMRAWTEKDFSYDITGGHEFIEDIAAQIAEYWEDVDQATIISTLTGVFAMTDTEGAKFVAAHTHDITKKTNKEGTIGEMDGTTLNTAIQKASGDQKGRFSLAIMHSYVATNLENLKLFAYLKYTDANGMERDLSFGTLNGRTVLVDDGMPTMTVEDKTVYVTYVLGDGAIEYTDCGAKVPYEVNRDPKTNGGSDTLYSRQRKCFAPWGISFTNKHMASQSPTDAELQNGENWELVCSKGETTEYIPHKLIPIARILSLG